MSSRTNEPALQTRSFLLVLGVIVLLSLPGTAAAQEMPGVHLPDSVRVVRDAFFVPSMSPSLSYIPPRFLENQLSLVDQAMIDPGGTFTMRSAAWKRSFLIGAMVYKPKALQPYTWTPRKQTFFQTFQAVLGYAVFAGVGYAAYRAIKEEPITKKK